MAYCRDVYDEVFPKFDLVSILEELERSFAPISKFPIKLVLRLIEQPPYLRIVYYNDYDADSDALVFDRAFSIFSGEIWVDHRYCIVPVEHQGKGIIKGLFQISLQQYVNMGARKITVHSGLEGGGYAWAKAGFVAVDKNEVEVILEAARRILQPDELARVERVYNKYYTDFPNGNAFPIVI
jgi:hypothetical protein